MNPEPIFGTMADDLSRTIRGHRARHAARVTFEQDRRNLPIFAAIVKTHGWNGLHMARATMDDTATFPAIQ